MTRLIEACAIEALAAGDMLAVYAEGAPPLAVFNIGGEFHATSNLCTHNIATLTDGYLDGDIIECPLHGGAFNVRTGEATAEPCETPLEVFETVVRDGAVFVVLPDPD